MKDALTFYTRNKTATKMIKFRVNLTIWSIFSEHRYWHIDVVLKTDFVSREFKREKILCGQTADLTACENEW